MRMSLTEPLSEINFQFKEIIRELDNGQPGVNLLDTYGIDANNPEHVAQIRRECEAMRYLSGLIIYSSFGRDTLKPDMRDLESAFNRHLTYLSEKMNCHQDNWQKERRKPVKREYEACRHYLVQINRPEWVEALPERILCFASQYPNYDYENNRHR